MNTRVTRHTLAITIAGAALSAALTGCSHAQDAAGQAAGAAKDAAGQAAGQAKDAAGQAAGAAKDAAGQAAGAAKDAAGQAAGAAQNGAGAAQNAAGQAAGGAPGAAGAVSGKLQDILRVNPVTFAPQSAQLSDTSTATLQQIATVLKTSGATATVSTHAGYADATQAQQLSTQRAEAIAKALQEGGVDPSKIKSEATGNTAAQGDQALLAQISAP